MLVYTHIRTHSPFSTIHHITSCRAIFPASIVRCHCGSSAYAILFPFFGQTLLLLVIAVAVVVVHLPMQCTLLDGAKQMNEIKIKKIASRSCEILRQTQHACFFFYPFFSHTRYCSSAKIGFSRILAPQFSRQKKTNILLSCSKAVFLAQVFSMYGQLAMSYEMSWPARKAELAVSPQ